LIRERETRLKENSFWLAALQGHYINNDRLLSLEDYKAFINSFSGDDIKAIARKYLNTESYVQVELTPAAKAEIK
jgi:predicted Zn-dependent peptidase